MAADASATGEVAPHVPTPEPKHLGTTYSLETWANWCEDTADTLAGLALQLRRRAAENGGSGGPA